MEEQTGPERPEILYQQPGLQDPAERLTSAQRWAPDVAVNILASMFFNGRRWGMCPCCPSPIC